MAADTTPTPPAVRLLAQRLWKDYDSQYSASHLTWVDFEGEARGHLEALADAGLLADPAKVEQLTVDVEQARADLDIRRAALNGVLGHPASSDFYAAIEEVAQLRAGARDLLKQIQGLGERNRLLQAGVERRNEILGELWLYVNWRYITGQLTTEQKELWADAIDALGDPEDQGPKAERWWRDDFVEDNRG